MATKRKQNTKASQRPTACSDCEQLRSKQVFFHGRRGVEMWTYCNLDEHRIDGDLTKVDEGCPLAGGETDGSVGDIL